MIKVLYLCFYYSVSKWTRVYKNCCKVIVKHDTLDGIQSVRFLSGNSITCMSNLWSNLIAEPYTGGRYNNKAIPTISFGCRSLRPYKEIRTPEVSWTYRLKVNTFPRLQANIKSNQTGIYDKNNIPRFRLVSWFLRKLLTWLTFV